MGDIGVGQMRGLQRATPRTIDPCIGRNPVEVLVGQQPLSQRSKGNHAGAQLLGGVQQVLFNPAIKQVVRRLVDQQRHFPLFEQGRHFAGFYPGIRGDPDVQRLALLHCGGQGAGGFFQWRVGIEAVRVEDVDIVQPQALQALIQAGQYVLARTAALAVRAGPHVPAGFTGDNQLVTVVLEVFAQ